MGEPETGDFTVGIEEEFQLVDPESGALRSRARAVLASDWTGEIKPEMQQNTVEVETRICRDTGEAREELARLRFQAAIVAESRGLRVVAAGTHPFSSWEGQQFTPDVVYERIRTEYRRLARSQNIFGLHVHVGVPPTMDRVRLMNAVRHYLPHLLALSVSSPFFLGEDTGYASYRSILWRRWPRSGPPPRMEDEGEFRRLVEALLSTGRIDAPGRIYWELRPHHMYPTLEFRVADVTPRLDDAVAVAGLCRTLVVAASEGLLPEPPQLESIARTFLVENAWIASRDGLGAAVVDYHSSDPVTRPIREVLEELCGRLGTLAGEIGEDGALVALGELLERGDAALRLRRCGDASEENRAALVRWLADETVLGVGLDRRAEQRDVC